MSAPWLIVAALAIVATSCVPSAETPTGLASPGARWDDIPRVAERLDGIASSGRRFVAIGDRAIVAGSSGSNGIDVWSVSPHDP